MLQVRQLQRLRAGPSCGACCPGPQCRVWSPAIARLGDDLRGDDPAKGGLPMHEYIAFFVTICERWLGVALVHRHCAIHCAGLPAVLFVADGTWLHTTAYATRYLHPAPLAAMLCVVSDSPLSNACVLGGSLMTYSARLVVTFPTTARRPCHDICVSFVASSGWLCS